jgi:hypothetical protein
MPYPIRPNVNPTPFVRQPGVQPTAGGVSPMPNMRPTPTGPPNVRNPNNPQLNPVDPWGGHGVPPGFGRPITPIMSGGWHWNPNTQSWEGGPQITRGLGPTPGSQGFRGHAPGPVSSGSYGGGMSVGSVGGGGQQEQLAMLLQMLMGQGG